MVERNLLVTGGPSSVIFSGFFEPLFYLFSMDLGWARSWARSSWRTQQRPYAVFVARHSCIVRR